MAGHDCKELGEKNVRCAMCDVRCAIVVQASTGGGAGSGSGSGTRTFRFVSQQKNFPRKRRDQGRDQATPPTERR